MKYTCCFIYKCENYIFIISFHVFIFLVVKFLQSITSHSEPFSNCLLIKSTEG